MHNVKYAFSQLLDFLDKDVFLRLVNKLIVNLSDSIAWYYMVFVNIS